MKVIFAGGGTAGHVNPALAAADYFAKRELCDISFAGGRGGIEEKLVGRAGYPIFSLPVSGLSRSISLEGLRKNAAALRNLGASMREAKRIVRAEKPDIVIGTGGYACYPMVAAAQSLGVKTALLEVNATPGVALKRLSRRANLVMLAFEETAHDIPNRNTVVTGNPVREGILRCRERACEPIFPGGQPMVLSFWGSVGAFYMNKKMEGFIKLAAEKREFCHLHAAGAANYKWMPRELAEMGCDLSRADNIELREYIYDMERAMACASLVICRAGASTLAEICAAGLPSIIVPSPFVANNHQEKNARLLERAGAAVVLTEDECTPELLYKTASELLASPERLHSMGEKAREKAHPDALERIYQAVKSVL
ncbi:MAG: undecaprenyldiphospho-muramoylpentapeptide beta-N-acetylglucosaminyltransferase [Clostridium sp. SCN 57-10]|nr:MAG: undecaprenyldiphospho-muramoylpentapeptide beta-N-acetylglucosaminyltransferase [Clostridium sp. SCN 57-10]